MALSLKVLALRFLISSCFLCKNLYILIAFSRSALAFFAAIEKVKHLLISLEALSLLTLAFYLAASKTATASILISIFVLPTAK